MAIVSATMGDESSADEGESGRRGDSSSGDGDGRPDGGPSGPIGGAGRRLADRLEPVADRLEPVTDRLQPVTDRLEPVTDRLPSAPTSRRGRLALVAVVFLVVLVVIAAALLWPVLFPGPDPTVEEVPTRDAFVVALGGDGDARVMSVRAYDLSNATERDAFERLAGDDAEQRAARDAFAREMRALAGRAEGRTGRSMRVRDPAILVERRNETGVVATSVVWENLATSHQGRLVVREPFAGGYDPGTPLLLQAPEDYTVTGASPGMDGYVDRTATWRPTSDLGDFRAVVAPSRPVMEVEQGGRQPRVGDPVLVPILGWGPTEVGLFVVIVALEALAYAVYRRWKQ